MENPKPVNNGSASLEEIKTAPFEVKRGREKRRKPAGDPCTVGRVAAPTKWEALHHMVNIITCMK